jgi:glycosyltransferase involved in cell wall biosynthesis
LAWSGFDRVVMVTESDAQAVRAIAPELPLRVITNGVDVGELPDGPVDAHRVVFHGVLRYPPNLRTAMRLARRVMPLVRKRVPEASLILVGRDPPAEVVSLGSLPGVEVVGEVPDVVPWLAGSRVYACAIDSGTGVKNKVLEAFAAGVPVVSTALGVQGHRDGRRRRSARR